MTSTDRTKLINDKALSSLRDELRLQTALETREWISIHSHHYFDLREKQWRELDAVASKMWAGYLSDRPIRVKVVFLVESKSIREKHVLLPPHAILKQAVVFDWLGSYRRRDERFRLYEEAGLDRKLATSVDSVLTGGAADVMPDAPNILLPPRELVWHSAGFVEAQNTAGMAKRFKKELGSSVVWRARLSLQSAAQALAQEEIEAAAGELGIAIRFARLRQMSRGNDEAFDMKAEVVSEMASRAFTITVFHPVIVVDADLWGVDGDDVIPVNHARVHLTGISRYPYFWFDLVQREAVNKVIREAQANYDQQASERGLHTEEVNLGTADYEIAYP